MNILVVAAHPDDEVIGVGGTIYNHSKKGDNVYVVILAEGKSSRYENYKPLPKDLENASNKETEESSSILGIRAFHRLNLPDNRLDDFNQIDINKKVEYFVNKYNPEIIYTHNISDINKDHSIVYNAVVTAARPIVGNSVKKVLSFETLSSTEWNFEKNNFTPNYFVDITDSLQYKIEAMKKYDSELNEFPHPRSLKTITYNAYVWGSKVGRECCEAFKLIRYIE